MAIRRHAVGLLVLCAVLWSTGGILIKWLPGPAFAFARGSSVIAVSVNLLYGFGRFNLQNPGYPPAHFSWCEPCISHRVVRYQPHAIATMAGGFYAHGSAPLAAARSFSPGPRCVPAGFRPLGYATPRSPGAVHPHPAEPRDRHPL